MDYTNLYNELKKHETNYRITIHEGGNLMFKERLMNCLFNHHNEIIDALGGMKESAEVTGLKAQLKAARDEIDFLTAQLDASDEEVNRLRKELKAAEEVKGETPGRKAKRADPKDEG